MFFYDGPVSRAVAFEGLLNNGEAFASRLAGILSDQRDGPQLAHIATDGETYGHHHAHGDMALAYAIEHIQATGLTKITNYGEFLELHPPEHDVDILENTSWSCIHGVDRWRLDCGCNSGGHAGWNQQWRAPLRDALDWLRDEIAPRYERAAARLLKDPWAARDDYIRVILDRSEESRDRFAARHFRRKDFPRADWVHIWKLLELQRNAMLMYTSCGWFFDELSGLETVQVIQYAGRVVQLSRELFPDSIEPGFVERLALAKSNIAEHRDGAHIYEKFVKPAMVDLGKVAGHYSLGTLFFPQKESARIYCYSVDTKDHRQKRSGEMQSVFGKARFTSEITQESEMLLFGAMHAGGHTMYGGAAPFPGDTAYHELARATRGALARSDYQEAKRLIDQACAGQTCSLQNVHRDEQRRIVNQVIESQRERAEITQRLIYDSQASLMRFLAECHIPIPRYMQATAEVVLNALLRDALAASELDMSAIQALLDDVRLAGVPLDAAGLEIVLRRNVETICEEFFDNPRDIQTLRKCREAMTAAKSLPLTLVLWSVQNRCYALMQTLYPEMRKNREIEWMAGFEQLAALLSLRA